MKKKKSPVLPWMLILCGIGVFILYILQEREKLDKNAPMPTELHPVVAEKKDQLIKEANEIGIQAVITDDFRSAEEQDELYAKGRTAEGNIVTHVKGGESYHNYGLAIDFAIRLDNGEVIWDMEFDGNNNGKADWMEIVGIAKDLGFTWGGDWQVFKDYPHLEIRFGMSIRDLQNGERP